MAGRELLLWSELATVGMVSIICGYFLLASRGLVRPPLRDHSAEAAAAWRSRQGAAVARWAGIILLLNLVLAAWIGYQLCLAN
jgi:type VI protein secretion system component VasF